MIAEREGGVKARQWWRIVLLCGFGEAIEVKKIIQKRGWATTTSAQ